MPKECPGNQRKQHGGNIQGRDTAPAARCRNPEGRRLGHTKKRRSLYKPAMGQLAKGDHRAQFTRGIVTLFGALQKGLASPSEA